MRIIKDPPVPGGTLSPTLYLKVAGMIVSYQDRPLVDGLVREDIVSITNH